MASKFSLKDMGTLSYFLGVEVIPHQDGWNGGYKLVSTPISATGVMLKSTGTLLPSPTNYQTVVGSLQYLGLMWPDVGYSINKLSHLPPHFTRLLSRCFYDTLLEQQLLAFIFHLHMRRPLMGSPMLIGQRP
ncbi:hypothetical protein V2J09_015516 [Rumex salicifolius]